MNKTARSARLSPLSLLVTAIAIAFLAGGVFFYGVSTDVLHRMWGDLFGRYSGPMTFRFILQPAMAAIAATRDAVNDARMERSPFFCSLVRPASLPRKSFRPFVVGSYLALCGSGDRLCRAFDGPRSFQIKYR